MSEKRITIADIAKKSGYSKTAVSFAFNNPERISRDAVEKILAVAKELDYIPDPMARNFSLGRHFSLGFLVPQTFDISLDNPHVVDILRGIGSVCEKHGYTFTLIPPLHSSIAEAIKNATVDGIVGMGLDFGGGVKEALQKRKLPLVRLDAIDEEEGYSVSIDNTEAAYTQMKEVLKCGHRDIAIVTLPGAAYIESTQTDVVPPGVANFRMIGYRKALAEYNITKPVRQYPENSTINGGRAACSKIIEGGLPSAIVTMSDIQAVGVIEELKNNGLRVPEDISVVGFDGIYCDKSVNNALTTINQHGYTKGVEVARMLFDIINGEEREEKNVLVPFSFFRGSTLLHK